MDKFLNPKKRKIDEVNLDKDIAGDGGEQKRDWYFLKVSSAMYSYANNSNIKSSLKLIAFDLDGTLILTKSGKIFPKDHEDWKFFSPEVPLVLRKLHDEGHCLLIISNQKGVGTGCTSKELFKRKIEKILKKIEVPMDFICSFERDMNRKPLPGSWDHFMKERYPHIASHPDYPHNCTYVGDAAGRPQYGSKKRDFAATDLKFALNLGINFLTPEQLFFSSKNRIDCDRALAELGFSFKTLVEDVKFPVPEPPSPELFTELSGSPELVLLVGPPACGKSTLARGAFSRHVRVNQDQLRTRANCLAAARRELQANNGASSGRSVMVDNTNVSAQVRAEWVQLAKDLNVPIRSVTVRASKELCFHLAQFRDLSPETLPEDRRHIETVVIHTYFKNFQEPQLTEGFTRCDTIDFAPVVPADAEAARLLRYYLL